MLILIVEDCHISYRGASMISELRELTSLNLCNSHTHLEDNPGITFNQFFELLHKLRKL